MIGLQTVLIFKNMCFIPCVCYVHLVVFMGSERYPEENECEAFLTKHGGYSNAATDCEMVGCVRACMRV